MDRRWHQIPFASLPQLLCLAVTCFFAVLVALALIYLGSDPAEAAVLSSAPLSSASTENRSTAASGPQSRYLIKNHGGRLAVFQAQEQSPLLVFDVYISTLPEYDQQLLQEGIPAEGEEQLTRLIEDYVS